jgi:MOSC domain-containing protein YiiM/GNAT superfamily N-acetyltransferase
VSSGRVVSVNISPGGVPKLPVERAWVGELGLNGDMHREDTVHGGPLRAVCLFGIEVIERLQAEGHPIKPGSVGENLTTSGTDWSRLPSGTRVKVGNDVLLELISPAMPCDTQRPNFIRGEFKRISPVLFPGDSRMYGRVLAQGEVRPGDLIEVQPVAADNDPDAWDRLFRVDAAELTADVRLWAAAASSGLGIHVSLSEELAMAAAPNAPEPAFNHALGLRTLPHLLPRVLDFYRHHQVPGCLGIDRAPWPGAVPDARLAVIAADVADLPGESDGAAGVPEGFAIRRVGSDDAQAWASVAVPSFGEAGFDSARWSALLPHLLASRGIHAVLGESRGKPVAAGLIFIHKKVALLRTGTVQPEARGHGLQRALIRARLRIALDEGCDVVAAHAVLDGISQGNLLACGLRQIATRDIYLFNPADDHVPSTTERVTPA